MTLEQMVLVGSQLSEQPASWSVGRAHQNYEHQQLFGTHLCKLHLMFLCAAQYYLMRCIWFWVVLPLGWEPVVSTGAAHPLQLWCQCLSQSLQLERVGEGGREMCRNYGGGSKWMGMGVKQAIKGEVEVRVVWGKDFKALLEALTPASKQDFQTFLHTYPRGTQVTVWRNLRDQQ